ncbi:succinylglutamate desuccinylase/aspartoacylase family protein [Halorussus gelatinilyticus]|uniref:Succinylglutamate desuccinylase/aspartoacylase family protein n=1 Tax=Halorussus gelatinilyticus TaxID=2937524 RepID=A0A8U0IIH8_9EURY|nr:succinylglutamate desuccinylase/aspartoacylase family protein [Halorussus gelatinilyticus]UPW00833.1 succinylglutamate desuccinylase/aspartoacylase family protein [Halorussus gelatinilyticus]
MDHTAERVTLARLPSGVEIETTVHTYDGDDEGPTVYVQAAQHGREINGTETLRRVHDRLVGSASADADGLDLAGRLVAVPVADPLTFDRVSYTTPEQLDSVNPNMNRVWPGDAEGTVHERMAATLWEYVADADAVVDLHTGSADMLTHVVFMEGHEESRALAEAFGTDLLLSEEAGKDADDEWAKRDFDGKLRVAATHEGIPTITPELAHNKQLVEDAVDAGVEGTLAVLRHLDLLPGDPDADGERRLARNHLGRVTADDAGLFRLDPDREVGQRVEPGERVGTVYDPTTYEVLQEAETDREGILYSLTREATVSGGETLLSVALPRDE